MLSKINISNLDNSVASSSIYSDACQNSMELEEYNRRIDNMEKLQSKSIKANDNDKNFKNSNIYNSTSEIFESFSQEQNEIKNLKIEKNKECKNIYENQKDNKNYIFFNRKNGVNNSIDILKYKNDRLKIIYDSQIEKINLINKSTISEIINNNNINNLNLSNFNIIINKEDNYYSGNKRFQSSKKINTSTVSAKNKKNNLSEHSQISNYSIENSIRVGKNSIKKSQIENKCNSINNISENKKESKINNQSIKSKNNNNDEKEDKDIDKNLNINILNDKNNNLENEQLNKSLNLKNEISRKSINNLSTNLGINSFNGFDNVVIINKIKKTKRNIKNNTSKIDNVSKNENSFNSSFVFSSNSLLINTIKFEGIENNEIDLNFFKSLRIIPIKNKKKNKKKYLKTLLELQHFFIDDIAIRVIKISEDGKYLSAGMSNGKIKLFEIIGYDYNKFEVTYNKENVLNYFNFVNEKPYKILTGHTQDVIDLSWSLFFHNLLLSGSLDNVILWDVSSSEEKCKIESFEHTKMVTCVSFSPTEKYKFASGCLDKFVRIWDFKDILNAHYNNLNENSNKELQSIDIDSNEHNSINLNKIKKYNILYFNIEEKITSISFFPTGEKIAIGTHNGKIIIYEIKSNKFDYKGSFSCKNRIGKNSFGKKITSIEFFNKNNAIISSCDSRIRLMSMNDGKIIHKYKGYLNENSMIRSSIDFNYDIIISGSEDGYCYVWDIENEEKKILNYENFKPYSQEKVHCSLIVSEKCYCNFFKKIMKITNKLIITSIIINGTDKGRLEILLNIDDKN